MQTASQSDPRTELHAVEAEQQLIGAILNNNSLYDKVSDLISAKDFFDPIHAELWEFIVGRIDAQLLASPATAAAAFRDRLKDLGGARYLANLSAGSIASHAIRDYAVLVVEAAQRLKLYDDLTASREEVAGKRKSPHEIALKVEANAAALCEKSTTKPLIQNYSTVALEAVRQINAVYSGEVEPGVSTGLTRLDQKLNLMRAGNMIVLAGRPAMGKTTIGQSISHAVASGTDKTPPKGVFFGSLEMLATEVGMRFLAKHLAVVGKKIPYSRMIAGKVSEAEMRDIITYGQEHASLPIIVGEKEVREVSKFRSAARRAKQRFEDQGIELGLVVVDYVQKMEKEGARSMYESASYCSDMCKSTGLDLGVPVLALAQLSREVERRDPPIPMLSDLRETGKLEEDADVVMFAFRNAYYLERKLEQARNSGSADDGDLMDLEAALDSCRNQVELIVAKQRSGETGSVAASINLGCCHVYETSPITQDHGRELF